MKPPAPPPNTPLTKRVVEFAQSPAGSKFTADANRDYWGWEEVRRHPIPKGISAEDAWAAISVSRWANSKYLSLTDLEGKPFTYSVLSAVSERLHRFDRLAGSLLSARDGDLGSMSVLRDRALVSSLMEESISTAMIEGAVTTRRVAKEMLRNSRRPRTHGERMVVNGYRTISKLRDEKSRDLDSGFLLEIQASLTEGTLDDETAVGRFRAPDERVWVVDHEIGMPVFTPPPADALEARLDLLFRFASASHERDDFIHPLVKASILHFWIAYEHPFVDGNGRTARAVLYWWLLKQGYELIEFLSISRVIQAAPARYYRSFLYSETYGNDLTYSILNVIDAALHAVDELKKYLHAKLVELKALDSTLRRDDDLNHRQRALLAHALRHPDARYTFESHKNSHAVSYLTARSDLLALQARGFVSVERKGRKMFFRPAAGIMRRVRPR